MHKLGEKRSGVPPSHGGGGELHSARRLSESVRALSVCWCRSRQTSVVEEEKRESRASGGFSLAARCRLMKARGEGGVHRAHALGTGSALSSMNEPQFSSIDVLEAWSPKHGLKCTAPNRPRVR